MNIPPEPEVTEVKIDLSIFKRPFTGVQNSYNMIANSPAKWWVKLILMLLLPFMFTIMIVFSMVIYCKKIISFGYWDTFNELKVEQPIPEID